MHRSEDQWITSSTSESWAHTATRIRSFAPEEHRNDGHQGGGGQDDLHPLVGVHLRPPDAGLPAAGGHLAPPLVVCGEAVEDGALRVTDTSDADA